MARVFRACVEVTARACLQTRLAEKTKPRRGISGCPAGQHTLDRGDLATMSFEDRPLPCRDCGTTFVFTAGEQAFYAEKGFTNEPGRCPACRRAYKTARGLT